MPDVVGMQYEKAKTELIDAGFVVVDPPDFERTDEVDPNEVLKQKPSALTRSG